MIKIDRFIHEIVSETNGEVIVFCHNKSVPKSVVEKA